MKQKILLFLLLVLFTTAKAANSYLINGISNEPEPEPKGHKMILSFKSGDNVAFVLKDKPQITFNGSLLVLESSTGNIEYLRSDIEDFHFEEIETSVESIEYSGVGNATIFDLNGRFVATLCNENLNTAKKYMRSDIEDFHFEEIETSVESIEYSGVGNATIFDLNGRFVATLCNENLNTAKKYINTFKPGMYIIKIGNQSIKYLKK